MSQLQKGTTYGSGSPANQVTYTNLNAHVDDAELLAGAITEQTDIGAATVAGDYLIIYDASADALRKVALSGLLYANQVSFANLETDFIADATAKTTPVAADIFLIADSAASNASKRATFAQVLAAIPAASITYAMLDTDFIADATAKTTPVVADTLLIADSAAANITKKCTITQLLTALRFTGSNTALPGAGAAISAQPHGLGAVPRTVRWVMVCTTTDLGYSVSDEVPLESFTNDSGSRPAFTPRADATNLNLVQTASTIRVARVSDASQETIATANWRLKAYASVI